MTITITIDLADHPGVTADHVKEWAEYQLGLNGCCSGDNPCFEIDMSDEFHTISVW